MVSKLGTWRQKIQQHPFIVIGIIVLLITFLAFALAVHWWGWDWTGFNGGYHKISIATDTKPSPQKTTKTEEQEPAKTFWDVLLLLAAVAIPVVAGFGAAWFTAQHGKVSERENKDNQREKVLQDYIDKMSELLLDKDKPLRQSKPEDEVRTIARVRTITLLFQLDARCIEYVFTFLRECGLMSTQPDSSIVSLAQADLKNINFSQAVLKGADLRGVDLRGADLSRADLGPDFSEARLNEADPSKGWYAFLVLRGANLSRAYLPRAKLSEANLRGADLSRADLSKADLRGARISEANLSEACLSGANLSEANLSEACLSGANFSEANLKDATGITTEELEKQAKSLKGATMPDGSIHP